MEEYITVSFKAGEETTSILEAFLMEMGFEGMEEKDDETLASISVSGFDETQLKEVFGRFKVTYRLQTVPQQNWNAAWELSFEPVLVDDFAAIRAAFHAPVTNVDHEIIITPKMSFGTGHHATTFLVMQQMRRLDFNNQVVIDFGTGTGVLAILVEKLGAKEILAIDNDDWSINNAKENIDANGCSHITLQQANEMIHTQKAGIVLANINLNVIIANLDAIKDASLPAARIIFSGLLVQDEPAITGILTKKGFNILETVQRNNWIALRTELI